MAHIKISKYIKRIQKQQLLIKMLENEILIAGNMTKDEGRYRIGGVNYNSHYATRELKRLKKNCLRELEFLYYGLRNGTPMVMRKNQLRLAIWKYWEMNKKLKVVYVWRNYIARYGIETVEL